MYYHSYLFAFVAISVADGIKPTNIDTESL